jgi:hypothetical protein
MAMFQLFADEGAFRPVLLSAPFIGRDPLKVFQGEARGVITSKYLKGMSTKTFKKP